MASDTDDRDPRHRRRGDQRSLHRDELPGEAHIAPQTFYEEGARAGSPAEGSLKVGWTLRNSSNKILHGFAFLINPQGLTRGMGSRGQLFSTKGGHYVDDFGPGPGQIQLRQLVAEGKNFPGGFYTAREDVQRFLSDIFLPATNANSRGRYRVYFHDHHFERGFAEQVYFPPNALTIERSVDLHNVWRLDLQMVSLEKYPYDDAAPASAPRGTKVYTCKKGDTLGSLSRRVAGKRASAAKVRQARDAIVKLNPWLKQRRRLPDGRMASPMRLHVGEVVRLP